MATLGDINTKISSLTGVDTNTYTNAMRLVDLNLWHQKIVGMILDAQDEADFDDQRYTDYPSVTFPMTTNRDYSFSQFQTNTAGLSYSLLKLKDVSFTYDGTNYYRATPMDITDYEFGNAPSSETTANTKIDANFAKTAPRYDYKFNSFSIYPKASQADVDAGAEVIAEWFRSPVEFTSAELSAGNVSPGIDPTFHMMYAYGAANEYATAQQLPQRNEIARTLQDYEDRLRRQYSTKQLDRKYQFQADYQNYK